jgi:hypothetical protein
MGLLIIFISVKFVNTKETAIWIIMKKKIF